jgi:hypothetical protein
MMVQHLTRIAMLVLIRAASMRAVALSSQACLRSGCGSIAKSYSLPHLQHTNLTPKRTLMDGIFPFAEAAQGLVVPNLF